jgi:uncharacterized Zn finger protein
MEISIEVCCEYCGCNGKLSIIAQKGSMITARCEACLAWWTLYLSIIRAEITLDGKSSIHNSRKENCIANR